MLVALCPGHPFWKEEIQVFVLSLPTLSCIMAVDVSPGTGTGQWVLEPAFYRCYLLYMVDEESEP